ncbi:hypothetical protein [Peribacillus sp. TH14]|uniref:hypothetical protein n=1 Tax=Peribacillus sp. TH14 TaxID=2798481 RepID=UPI001912B4FC|nr:hypothetical protein [Peribacillus sp. TH14]MBK5502677.1 hypothetical protein [Peribacillus sp. TH14]
MGAREIAPALMIKKWRFHWNRVTGLVDNKTVNLSGNFRNTMKNIDEIWLKVTIAKHTSLYRNLVMNHFI